MPNQTFTPLRKDATLCCRLILFSHFLSLFKGTNYLSMQYCIIIQSPISTKTRKILDRQSVMVLPVLASKTAVLLCESEIEVHLPRDIALYLFLFFFHTITFYYNNGKTTSFLLLLHLEFSQVLPLDEYRGSAVATRQNGIWGPGPFYPFLVHQHRHLIICKVKQAFIIFQSLFYFLF